MIPEQIIGDVRDRVDMVALVGEYVRLVKRGNSHVGLCPFHAEKTPSFHVSAANKFYHCFGCKESGDPFSFLMKVEGIAFPQAARVLAERAGVEIPDSERGDDVAERRARERTELLAAINDEACKFYEQRLQAQPADSPARRELEKRGVLDATAQAFRLGYAPASWDALATHLKAKGFTLADAEENGLVARRRDGSGHYDRFRNRLMFPVRELAGRVVAFSGRVLAGPDGVVPENEPKYMNSPEGPLYHKGSVLFGLHEARVEVRRNGWAIVCEGNFDLLALHQAGFANAVAPLGTAFTSAQAKLLRRFAERAVLLFDGDNAGRKAVRAAFPLLQEHGLRGSVARLPSGDDPDSFLRAQGPDGMKRVLSEAQGIVEHLIDAAAEGAGASAAERASAFEGVADVLTTVENTVELEIYIERVAQRFGLPDSGAVRRQLRGRAGYSGRSVPPTPQKSAVAAPPERVKLPQLQTELLGALLDQPSLFASSHAEKLRALLTTEELSTVFRLAEAVFQENGVLEPSALLSVLEGNAALPWVRERLARPQTRDLKDADDVLSKCVPLLSKQHLERSLQALKRQIVEARSQGDEARAIELHRQRVELERSGSR